MNEVNGKWAAIIKRLHRMQVVHTERILSGFNFNCWLIRGSLFIELGCPRDLGKGWRGDLGTFMISRPI